MYFNYSTKTVNQMYKEEEEDKKQEETINNSVQL
jgi:hypothetical protein